MGPSRRNVYLKFQDIPEVESGVTVVSLSFLSEVVLLENIFSQGTLFLPILLTREENIISSYPSLWPTALRRMFTSDYFWGDAGASISNLDFMILGARLRFLASVYQS